MPSKEDLCVFLSKAVAQVLNKDGSFTGAPKATRASPESAEAQLRQLR